MELFDRVAVVTGAASGAGLIAAGALFRAGASVYLTDIDREAGPRTAERMRATASYLQDCAFVPMDVGDPLSVAAAAGHILGQNPCVDILVNSAGWAADGEAGPLAGPDSVVRAFVPSMIAHGFGRIINLSCPPALAGGGDGSPDSDQGVCATRRMARELAPHHINVNCVCMGPPEQFSHHAHDDGTLMPRFVGADDPLEIIEALLFFAGPASNHITGQMLQLMAA